MNALSKYMQAFIKSQCSEITPCSAGSRHLNRRNSRWTECIVFFFSLLPAFSAAPLNTLPLLDEVVAVKSVFTDNPQFGKDPFFPKSLRREPVVDNSNSNVVVEPLQTAGLSLKGISGTAGKRLAIINNRTFEVGEEMVLRVANQSFKVRCVEIREKSVIISVNNLSKELFLGQRLAP